MGRARCPMPAARLRVCETFQQPSLPRRKSTAGGRRWVPVCTGTTGGGGAPTTVIPVTAGIHGGAANPRRIRGGGRRWVPVCTGTTGGGGRTHNVIPATAGIHGGGRRWVPVCTGTTGGGGRTHNRHSRDGGNPRRGAGDGFPSARERRAAAGAPTIVIPATAGIRGGGPAMGSRLHGNDGRRRRTHNRHSREGGNPRWGAAMGSRLHGNDGRPAERHSRYAVSENPRRGAGDGFPSARERRAAAGGARRESAVGAGDVCTGTTGGGGVPTIVIPATAGIHGGGPAMGSRLHGNDGRRRQL